MHCVRNELYDGVLTEVRYQDSHILRVRHELALADLGANPKWLINVHVEEKNAVLAHQLRARKEHESVQHELELWSLRHALVVCLHLLLFLIVQHQLDTGEVRCKWLLIVVENVGIEQESQTLVYEEDLLSAQSGNLTLQTLLDCVESCENFVECICEHVLDSLALVLEKQSAALALLIKQEHGQLFEAGLLNDIVLRGRLQDVHYVCSAERAEIVATVVNKVQVLSHAR